MKKIINKVNFAVIALLTNLSAFAENNFQINPNSPALCKIVDQLHNVFVLLRMLAFVGAAFLIAEWAWGFIKGGEVKDGELKKKGTGLLVGFGLLFAVGMLLSFVTSTFGQKQLGCGLENW